MNINDWIAEYAEDNDIEIPEGIGDTNAVLNFLQLNSNSGGSSLPSVTIVAFDENYVLPLTWNEAKNIIDNGGIIFAILPSELVLPEFNKTLVMIYSIYQDNDYDPIYGGRIFEFNEGSSSYINADSPDGNLYWPE